MKQEIWLKDMNYEAYMKNSNESEMMYEFPLVFVRSTAENK